MSTQRTLDIRIGAVKRLTKEMRSRRVDVETENKRTEKLIAEGEDRWTVNKQKEVVAEAERMIPDAKQRLTAGLEDLQALADAVEDEISQEKKTEVQGVIEEGERALQD